MAPPVISTWVAEKFGSAVLSAAGGRAFSEVLNFLDLSGDRTPEILNKLDEIDAKASEILTRVTQIQAELTRLRAALKLTQEEIEAAINENSINEARSNIQSHYGKARGAAKEEPPADASEANSLLEALHYKRLNVPVNTKKFAENVLGLWKIRENVSQIASQITERVGHGSSLLRQWSQLLIGRVHVNGGRFTPQTLFQSYLTLEGWFQEVLQPQFQGIALVAAAKCHGKSDDRRRNEVIVTLGSFEAELVPQAELFLTLAAELIAQFQLDLPVGAPMVRQPTDEEYAVMRRASLLHAVLCDAVAEQPKGIRGLDGVYGLIFCGKDDAARVERHTLEAESYPKSAGTQLKSFNSPLVPTEWDGDAPVLFPVLRDHTDSKLNVFRYHFKLPTPAPSVGARMPFPFSTQLYWYAVDTLDVLAPDSKGPIITAAFFLFAQHVRPPEVREQSVNRIPAGNAVWNTNKDRAGFRKNEKITRGHALGLPGVLAEGTLEVHAAYRAMRFQGRQPSGFELDFPLFTYKGRVHDLEVGADVEFSLELEDARPQEVGNSVVVDPQLILWVGRPRDNGGGWRVDVLDSHDLANLAGQGTGAKGSGKRRATATIPVGDKGVGAETYALTLHVLVATELRGGMMPGTDDWAKAKITYKVSNFRMRWM